MIPLTRATSNLTQIKLAALPADDRFAFWNDVISDHFSPAENAPTQDPRKFDGMLDLRRIGQIGLSKLSTSGLTSRRSRNAIRRKPLDCFFVSYLTLGQARIEQGGRIALQQVGDFVMYDSAAPFETHMADTYAGSWIRLPRRLVNARMGNAPALTARALSGHTPIGRMVTGLLHQAHDLDLSADCPAANRIATSIVDLLAAALETQAGFASDEPTRFVNLLDRAKSFILANLEDPELDGDRLARSLGVSRRTLSRAFAHEGTTPIRWVWHQRLKRAHDLLLHGRNARVSDVAMQCGFSDFSHFSRSFRAEFGCAPKDVTIRLQ